MSPSPIDSGVVLITGASSGIGQAIAELCAPRARELVLVARRKDRLDALAGELSSKHPSLRVHVFECDLGQRDRVSELVVALDRAGLAIDVLVNNAGLGDLGVFDKSKLDKQLSMIDLNVTALVMLTHALLPGMVARGRGAVLMVSSGFGLSYLPGFAGYVGTKHFVSGFTESLHSELAGTGVYVGQICPGPVATEFEQNIGNFTGRKAPSLLEISAERCAREAVRAIDRRRALVVPHWIIKLLIWSSLRSPRWLTRAVMRLVGPVVRKQQEAKA